MRIRLAVPANVACVLLALCLGALPGCGVYLADQQSARLLPEGDWELTPSFSSVSFSANDETEHVQNHFGLRVGYGFSDRVEGRAVLERVAIDEDIGSGGVTLLGGGPKLALGDAAALFLPIGLVFGEDIDEPSETWTVAPTLLLTLQPGPTVEVNPSAKLIYPFAVEDPELLLNVQLGLGLALADGRVVLRPEGGFVINPGDEGVSWGWTLGASLRP